MTKDSSIWVILPVLNEIENLHWLLSDLDQKYNFMVVDNGSTDGSYEYCLENGYKVIKEPRKGYGKAVLTGANYINDSFDKAKIVVVFDADGTSPIDSIKDLITPIQKENVDFTIGQRTFSQMGAIPIHARIGNWLSVFLISLSVGYRYKDMGPLRAIRLCKLMKFEMIDTNYGWNVEMQMKAIKHSLKIKEIDIEYFKRKFGSSKISGSAIGSIRAGVKIISRIFYFHFKLRKNHRVSVSCQVK